MPTEIVEVAGHIVDSLILPKVLDLILEAGADYRLDRGRDRPHQRRPEPGPHRGHRRRRGGARRACSSELARPRRQPGRPTPTPSSSPPTATACSPPASTPRPTSPPTSASTATGSRSRTRRWTAASSSSPTADGPHRARCTGSAPATCVVVGHDGRAGAPAGAAARRAARSSSWTPRCPRRSRRRCSSPQVADRIRRGHGPAAARCWPCAARPSIHTGGGPDVARLVRDGWIDVLFAGNGFATHDIESNVLGTSLGVSVDVGRTAPRAATRNHLRVINEVRRHGSIAAAVEAGFVTGGVMYECVQRGVPVRARRLGPRRRPAARHDRPTSSPPPTPCASHRARRRRSR